MYRWSVAGCRGQLHRQNHGLPFFIATAILFHENLSKKNPVIRHFVLTLTIARRTVALQKRKTLIFDDGSWGDSSRNPVYAFIYFTLNLLILIKINIIFRSGAPLLITKFVCMYACMSVCNSVCMSISQIFCWKPYILQLLQYFTDVLINYKIFSIEKKNIFLLNLFLNVVFDPILI